MRRRPRLLALVTAIAVGVALPSVPALAQDPPTTEPTTTEPPVTVTLPPVEETTTTTVVLPVDPEDPTAVEESPPEPSRWCPIRSRPVLAGRVRTGSRPDG